MTVIVSRYNIFRYCISCLLILLSFSLTLSGQEEIITVNKNVYKRVVGGAVAATDSVIVDNLTDFDKFGAGDTVLLIQMKGVHSRVVESGFYGDLQDSKGSPGRYEFLIVEDVIPARLKVIFTNPISNSYDVNSDVQLIKVPSYYSATVTSDLVCEPWDSIKKTGGVLTMIVGRKLKLSANINVTGKGFTGAEIVPGDGTCSETDPATLKKFSYNASFTNSGLKGEGLVSRAWLDFSTREPIYPGFAKGRGANFNAGGGGNGRFSGGAGGSHIGTGGRGGTESYDLCATTDLNIGGKTVTGTLIEGGLFLGGGGGGSTYKAPGTGIKGGNGGGIIIILANEIDGNGHSISADGALPAGAASGIVSTGGGGAGGGGGGGSVALYLETFSATNLTLSAKGGQGGKSNGDSGEGGGGGGGLVWTNIATPANVSNSVAGGAKGENSGIVNSLAGTAGLKSTNVIYTPKLNGFLFNSIRSSGTSDLVDSVCSNNIPYSIIGTKPIGGSGDYAYIWQKQNDSGGPVTVLDSSTIAQNYTFPAPESDTFFIRRVVRDNVTLLRDVSKWLKVIVQPKIENNKVNFYSHITSLNDTICFNGDPALIDQLLPDLKVPTLKNLFYKWQDSTSSAKWGTALGTSKSYDPPGGLQLTKWYRRTVTSGRCADSSGIVRVTVLPVIQNNNISADQEICHEMSFADLTSAAGPVLSGGDNDYRFQWQVSTAGTGPWADASGTITGETYNPPESPTDTETKLYYSRIVFSGKHDVCTDTSSSVLLTEWKKISNNIISSADQVICSGSRPDSLIATIPADGNHTYTITWKQRIDPSLDFTSAAPPYPDNRKNYWPPQLTDTTWYRRYITSSACEDSSNIVAVNVHKPVSNFNVSLLSGTWDTTICSGAKTALLNGFTPGPESGTGNPANNLYQWLLSSVKTGPYTDISGSISEDHQPGVFTNASPTVPQYFFYKRKVTNGACKMVSDSAVKVTVLPKISNNTVSADQAVCYNTTPFPLTGPVLTGGAGGTPTWLWQQSTDGGTTWNTASVNPSNAQNYSPPQLTVPTSYRRLIFSGPQNCCKDTSNILGITINPLPVGLITTDNDVICDGEPDQSFEIQITGSTSFPMTVKYREKTRLSSNEITPSPVTGPGPALIAVNPAIPNNPVTDSLTFAYNIVSILDNKGCLATSLSGSRNILVYEVPVANAGPDDVVCGPIYKLDGTKNVGTGAWSYPGVPVTTSTPNGDDLEVTVDLPYTPSWNYIHRFYYKADNWTCTSTDSVDITFYLIPDTADAGADSTLFSLDKEVVLTLITPSVGTGSWSVISGGASKKNETTFSNLSSGDNIFEWRIVNVIDECYSADEVKFTVNDLIVPDAFSPNGDFVNDEFEIKGLDLDNSNVTLIILNSAGAEIYRTTNTDDTYQPWNGESMGSQVPDGTYYYLLIIESKRNDSMLKKSGFIILKRDKLQ